jgi:hypothetical protein
MVAVSVVGCVASGSCSIFTSLDELSDGGGSGGATASSGSSSSASASSSASSAVSASSGGGSGATGGGGSGGVGGEPATGGAGGGGPPRPQEVGIDIVANHDDAMWNGCPLANADERLAYSDNEPFLFVGNDLDLQCAAFRFSLPIPPGSTIQAAELRLTRAGGDNLAMDTLQIRAWDSVNVPPFDPTHTEAALLHDPAGVLDTAVVDWAPGVVDTPVVTPDLSALVQEVVDRPDWGVNKTLGLALLPQEIPNRYVGFLDSSAASDPPRLQITYLPP